MKALDEIYKIYTYASLGEKNRIENEIMKMYTSKSIVQKRRNKMKENKLRIIHENNSLHTSVPLESNRKTMKSASGKRPPDKTHSAPEKKLSSRISSA